MIFRRLVENGTVWEVHQLPPGLHGEAGISGLGLEAQRSAVNGYLNGGDWKLVEEFVEIESGKNSQRPQLAAALSACRLHGARLVVAKLDRL